jgi:hypothetical protein
VRENHSAAFARFASCLLDSPYRGLLRQHLLCHMLENARPKIEISALPVDSGKRSVAMDLPNPQPSRWDGRLLFLSSLAILARLLSLSPSGTKHSSLYPWFDAPGFGNCDFMRGRFEKSNFWKVAAARLRQGYVAAKRDTICEILSSDAPELAKAASQLRKPLRRPWGV